jgi:hypothetical protein
MKHKTAFAVAALAEHAAAIRRLGKQTVETVVEIGRHLTEAKAEIRKLGGSWGDWLEAEFNWSDQQARRFIHVFERKSELNKLLNSDFPVSALYALAAPQSPKEAAAKVVERAEAGKPVSVAEVKQIVEQAKGSKQPSSKPRGAGQIGEAAKAAADKPEPPPRDDVGATSAGEIARKDAEIEQLRNAKRQLEIKIAGLESEIEELRAKLAAGTGGDMSASEFQTAKEWEDTAKKWEETVETQRGIIARLEKENEQLRACLPPSDPGPVPAFLDRTKQGAAS